MEIDRIKVVAISGGGCVILDVDTGQKITLASKKELFDLVVKLREATIPTHTWTKEELAKYRDLVRVGRVYPKEEWLVKSGGE